MLRTGRSGVICVLGAFELIRTFVCKKKMAIIMLKILDAALQNRCPGKQMARICAPLVENV
jgi:N-acetylmuramic acid 6-phosphate (MurNAc-6-P) etherase